MASLKIISLILDLNMAKELLKKLISMDADNYYCYHGEKLENQRREL